MPICMHELFMSKIVKTWLNIEMQALYSWCFPLPGLVNTWLSESLEQAKQPAEVCTQFQLPNYLSPLARVSM